MRPLNRPMFRYGGPIKEGIMTGIKDRTIAGGNQVGTPMGNRTGFADPRKSLLKGLLQKAPGGQFLIDQTKDIIPRIFKKIKPTAVPKFRQTGLDKPIGMRGPMSQRATRIPFMERAGMFTRQNPFFVGATVPFGISAGLNVGKGIYDTGPGIVKSVALQAADLAVPDFIFDQDKFLADKKLREQNEQNKLLKEKQTSLKPKEKITTTTPKIDRNAEIEANRQRYYKLMGIDKMKKGAAYDSLIDASRIVQEEGGDLKGAIKSGTLQNKIIQANRERYYKLMGIDKMKKDATYDSLIDASKIIQEEGGDLKGAIKSGTLQSRIIEAIGKNLDKSASLKKQIDAAILKGEIEKDINKEKNTLDKLVKEKQLKVLDKQLKGGDLNDTLSELRKQGIVPEGPELASYALRNDIDIPKGHVLNTKDINNFLKDNPTLTVVDYLNDQNLKLQQAGKGSLNPGNYVVGKNILEVGEDGTVTDVII